MKSRADEIDEIIARHPGLTPGEVIEAILAEQAEQAQQVDEAKLQSDEQAETSKLRHGDWRGLNMVQQKYAHLKNPVVAPIHRDPDIEAAKGNGTLEQLYNQRVSKIRHGDVNALIQLKRNFRENGMEVW